MSLARSRTKVIAVIAAHNRVGKTVECIRSLHGLVMPSTCTLGVVLVDDGSTDGTSEAVLRQFPDVQVLPGTGNLFWGGAMHKGTTHALLSSPDYIWWLNDDIVVHRNCLLHLLSALTEGPGIATATVYDAGGTAVYGGARRQPFFRFRLVDPRGSPEKYLDIDRANGNCMLISTEVLHKVPLPDPEVYVHNGGDGDLSARAKAAGYRLVVARDAECRGEANLEKFPWTKPGMGFWERWRIATSRKYLYPPMNWDRCIKHGGPLGVLYFVRPYIAVLLHSVGFLVRDVLVAAGRLLKSR